MPRIPFSIQKAFFKQTQRSRVYLSVIPPVLSIHLHNISSNGWISKSALNLQTVSFLLGQAINQTWVQSRCAKQVVNLFAFLFRSSEVSYIGLPISSSAGFRIGIFSDAANILTIYKLAFHFSKIWNIHFIFNILNKSNATKYFLHHLQSNMFNILRSRGVLRNH